MLKILFQGDSITDGNRYKEVSQFWDLNHRIGHSWAYMVTGSLMYRHPMRFEFVNRGVSGDTVAELNERWGNDTLAEAPDVIALLVGTNDGLRNLQGERDLSCRAYREGLTALYERSLAANPAVRFVVLEPFCYPENELRAAIMGKIREIARETAERYGAVFVPMQEEFDRRAAETGEKYWIWDTTHPTEAGHWLMHEAFLAAAEPMLMELAEAKE